MTGELSSIRDDSEVVAKDPGGAPPRWLGRNPHTGEAETAHRRPRERRAHPRRERDRHGVRGGARAVPGRACLIFLLALIVIPGCSFGPRKINLLYGSNASGESPGPEHESPRLAVALFSDTREPDLGRYLGRVRNRYGIPTGSVYAQQDPIVWVSEGIARALVARGYAVERVTSSLTADDLPTFTGTVTQVTSAMYLRIEAHIEADVSLEHSGQTIATQHCVGSTLRWAGSKSARVYEEVFRQTLTTFIDDCMPKLIGMIATKRPL